jgi:hypothetical protein
MRAHQASLAVLLCFFAGTAAAQTTGKALDINLNSDSVRMGFTGRLGRPNYLADVGWLYNQDKGDVIHASFHVVDLAGSPGTALQAGLGLRLVHTRVDPGSESGTALALGGFGRYTLPNADRFHVAGYGYYAPDVTASGDQKEYYEIGARAGYSIIRDADIYIGVRRIHAKYKGSGGYTFDSSLNIGFEFRFN